MRKKFDIYVSLKWLKKLTFFIDFCEQNICLFSKLIFFTSSISKNQIFFWNIKTNFWDQFWKIDVSTPDFSQKILKNPHFRKAKLANCIPVTTAMNLELRNCIFRWVQEENLWKRWRTKFIKYFRADWENKLNTIIVHVVISMIVKDVGKLLSNKLQTIRPKESDQIQLEER